MQEWERVLEACEQTGFALCRLWGAVANWAEAVIKKLGDVLGGCDIVQLAAYTKAQHEHPEWVHKAEYSKKRRVRKKYHDRIMREYLR